MADNVELWNELRHAQHEARDAERELAGARKRIAEIEHDLSDVRDTRDKLLDLLRRPILTLSPDAPVELAWVAIGVESGIISSGKARELLGGLDVLTWRDRAPVYGEAIETLGKAMEESNA